MSRRMYNSMTCVTACWYMMCLYISSVYTNILNKSVANGLNLRADTSTDLYVKLKI